MEDVPLADCSVGVILPAAGSGERLGNATPKQYFPVQGKPLFLYAVEQFEKVPCVTTIVLVANDPTRVQNILINRKEGSDKIIIIVKGGSTRHRSIQAGLVALQENMKGELPKIVIVHDAVRPLMVPLDQMNKLISMAQYYGAAGFTRPLISTVVSANQRGFLESTLDRTQFLNSETPQAFQLGRLVEAYDKITAEELERGTECLQLVKKYSMVLNVKLIPGSEELWKVTVPRDLHSAVGCITALNTQVCLVVTEETITSKIIPSLVESLHWRVSKIKVVNQKVEHSSSSTNGQSPADLYSNIIIFHESGESKEENEIFPVNNFMDFNKEGMIIHVLLYEHENKEGLYKSGFQFLEHNKVEGQNSMAVYWRHSSDTQKMVEIISSIVLSNSAFSGQIIVVE